MHSNNLSHKDIHKKISIQPSSLKSFSLIELIVVIVILSTIMAVSTPKLAHFFRSIKLNQSARQMMIYFNSVRDHAVYDKTLYKIKLVSKWSQLEASKEEKSEESQESETEGQGIFTPVGGRFGNYELSESITLTKVIRDGETLTQGAQFEFDVLPMLSKNEITFILEDQHQNKAEVLIEAGSGIARIIDEPRDDE